MVYTSQIQSQPQLSNPLDVKILIVDDQKFVQQKLQQMLSSEVNLQIVGIASDGEKAIAKVESLKPNVVLIDIEMPKMNGIEATEIISQKFPDCKILVLSSHEREEYVQKAISAGADGYILKNTPAEDLVTAIHSVCKGYSHFGPKLLKKIQAASPRYIPKQLNCDDYCRIIPQPDSPPELSPAQADEFLPPIGNWLTWGGISVITIVSLAIPSTAILKYKTVVKTEAIVRPKGELRLVQAAIDGQISEILVKQGETVERGEAIATIDRSRFQTKQNQLKKGIEQQRLQLAQLNAQIASLESQIIAETERNQSEIAAANAELAGNRRNYQDKTVEVTTQVEEAQAQLRAVEATLNGAKAKYNRYSSVAKAGAIGKDQLAEAELEVKRQEQELEVALATLKRAVATLDPSTAEIDVSKYRIEQAKKSGRATIAGLNRETEALIQQRIEVYKQLQQDTEELSQVNKELKQTKITATTTGTIFQLGLRNPGQTVQSGQEIAQIIPENSRIEMKAAVPPQDISKLKVGQKVQMRVSACPYPDYGILEGKVSQIAKDTSKPPSPQTDDNTQARKAAPFYEVSITPDSESFGRGKNQCSLQLGMESRADIITKEETVLQFMLRKARLTSNF